MKYNVKNMSNSIVREIINWMYEGEYSEYNLESYEKLKERKSSMLDSNKAQNYLCYFYQNELIGYTNLVEKENGDLFLGIGIAPKHCSKGLGKELLIDTITRVKKKYTGRNVVLQVRSWNKRAINCYLKVGFEIVKTEVIKDHSGNMAEFVFMKYEI